MPAFTLPVSGLLCIIMAVGLIVPINKLGKYTNKNLRLSFLVICSFVAIFQMLHPYKIAERRSISRISRNTDIHNSSIYKNLEQDILDNHVLINTKCDDDLDVMFYKNVNAKCYYPSENELDSLKSAGRKFVRFKNFYHHKLPDYLTKDSSIIILDSDILLEK
jgi:hypothetical protein